MAGEKYPVKFFKGTLQQYESITPEAIDNLLLLTPDGEDYLKI